MSEIESDDEPERQGCLGAILGFFGIKLQPAESDTSVEKPPYRLTQRFLSAAEVSFFKIAQQVIPDDFVIVAKPRIADILFVPRGTQGKWSFENKIRSKHVDFLICDVSTMTPRLVIELDDKSHDRSDRKDRDVFVDEAFAAAGLAVAHVRVKAAYAPNEIRSWIMERLVGSAVSVDKSTTETTGESPQCPNCRVAMVQRVASKGANKGSRFWGCPNYPNCRHVIQT